MGHPKGFINIKRQKQAYRLVCERVKDYKEVNALRPDNQSQEQASRCMDCGVPFCHSGCPIGNVIPEWNDFLFHGQYKKAFELLNSTNHLPEVTGRVCPALCEYACVLGVNDDPVTIRENELDVIEHAFENGLIKPNPLKVRTGKKVAVVGSGPAGLSAAAELNRMGHQVTVFERDEKIGGIMRFGIPDFKLEKKILDRRINIWKREGIGFCTGANVGQNVSIDKLKKQYDAICLATGSRVPRDLKIPGRELKGIHFAMDYLIQANAWVAGDKINPDSFIDARDKKVVVIGGGDTGSDCVGTANRQGAACVVQIELLEQPPDCRRACYPWPQYPLLLKTTSSHEEGVDRQWAVLTKEFVGESGKVKKLSCVKVEFVKDEQGCTKIQEIPKSNFEIEADLVVLAVGFLHPEQELLEKVGVKTDRRGNIEAENYLTSQKGIFAAGDARRGQSLVVWAIYEGIKVAREINCYLNLDR